MINLNDVQIFISAAREGSLNRTARMLGVPTSTISRAITRLEKEVDLQLLRRTSRGIILTEIGRDYLEKCEEAVSELSAAHENLSGERIKPRGKIRLATTTSFARDKLMPVLKHFIHRYPEVRLEILFHGKFSASLDDNLDFYFQIGKPKDSTLKVKMFPPIRLCLVASPSYVERYGKPTAPPDLPEHFCIGYAENELASWRLTSKTEKLLVKVPLRISVADPVIQQKLALDGLGISLIPVRSALPDIKAGKLVIILPEWKFEPFYFHALYAERSSMAPKIKVFLDFVEEFTSSEFELPSLDDEISGIFQIS